MLNLNQIYKSYKENGHEICVLNALNLSVKKNEICLIKGASGSGKSTLLSIIAGIIRPDSGDVIIDGENITNLSLKFVCKFRRQNIGIIFQNFALIESLSAFDNVILPSIVDKTSRKDYAKDLLEKFQIYHKKDTLVKDLSGGQRQRVAIARALINEPYLILADEPTASLDSKLSLELLEFLRELNQTIIIASHDKLVIDSGFASKILELGGEENGNI
ncbi:MAG: ABC transporter ATP-binding protein [Campylobacter sp.]|nr:ABC transporter ATP-binding protein [Campylobacter sp.]